MERESKNDNSSLRLGGLQSLDTGFLTELGLLHQPSNQVPGREPRRWPVDLYLADCILAGVLTSQHVRLSDYLRATDDIITLDETEVRSRRDGSSLVQNRTALVTIQSVLFAVDRSISESSEQRALRVERRTQRVLLSVGPFWLRGQIHLSPSVDLHDYVRGATGTFLPLTEATIVGQKTPLDYTILINRAHLRCLLT